MANRIHADGAEQDTWDVEDDLHPGTRVDQWVIERKLGAGGFGTVYEARQPIIEKRVAIKVLARRFSVDPRAVARFVAEARIVNRIGHPSIVDIFAFGTLEDGRHYHVMELCVGETLKTLLERRGRFSLQDALPLLRSVASALDAAHDQGGVHRDLKPENVIVMQIDGVPSIKVIDFGIAKLLGEPGATEITESGAIMGTPRYMSPEQCRGRAVDARSDVYSFGVVAYEVLTGKPAFSGADSLEIMLKQTAETPRAPSELAPELSPAADAILLALLEKDRNKRPERLVEVVERLARVGRPPNEPSEHAPVTPARQPGRARRLVWGAAAALVGVVAVVIATTGAEEPSQPERPSGGTAILPALEPPTTSEPAARPERPTEAARTPETADAAASSTHAKPRAGPERERRQRSAGPASSGAQTRDVPGPDEVEDPFRR